MGSWKIPGALAQAREDCEQLMMDMGQEPSGF